MIQTSNAEYDPDTPLDPCIMLKNKGKENHVPNQKKHF